MPVSLRFEMHFGCELILGVRPPVFWFPAEFLVCFCLEALCQPPEARGSGYHSCPHGRQRHFYLLEVVRSLDFGQFLILMR